jgi:hypothetical protein
VHRSARVLVIALGATACPPSPGPTVSAHVERAPSEPPPADVGAPRSEGRDAGLDPDCNPAPSACGPMPEPDKRVYLRAEQARITLPEPGCLHLEAGGHLDASGYHRCDYGVPLDVKLCNDRRIEFTVTPPPRETDHGHGCRRLPNYRGSAAVGPLPAGPWQIHGNVEIGGAWFGRGGGSCPGGVCT